MNRIFATSPVATESSMKKMLAALWMKNKETGQRIRSVHFQIFWLLALLLNVLLWLLFACLLFKPFSLFCNRVKVVCLRSAPGWIGNRRSRTWRWTLKLNTHTPTSCKDLRTITIPMYNNRSFNSRSCHLLLVVMQLIIRKCRANGCGLKCTTTLPSYHTAL